MRELRQRWLPVVAGFVCVAVVSACGTTRSGTSASPAGSPGQFQAQGYLSAAGDPETDVNAYPGNAAQASDWSMCVPGAKKCVRIASAAGITDPGPQPAGTAFRFSATWHGRAYAASVRWRGALRVTTAPALIGMPRFGATVTARAARWSGGWGTEIDELGIEACRTARATGCVMLTGDALQCSGHGCGILGEVAGTEQAPDYARVGNWYTGWYLFALDAHLSDNVHDAVGYESPAAIPPWPRNGIIVHSRPYGPVIGPQRPKIDFLSRAQMHGGRVLVATVQCAVSCPVAVSVILRHAEADQRNQWSAHQVIKGTGAVRVSGPLPPGQVNVTVQVGNGPAVTGHSLIQ